MAIPTNYIDKITKDGESRDICPAADKVRVNNDNFDGENLDEVLDEMKDAIDDAASQGGIQTETDPTVPSHVKNITQQNITDWNNKYTKPNTGIPASDLAESVQDTLDDVNNKANSSEVIKSISVNGQTPQTPQNGNVNIEVQAGLTKEDISVETHGDGTVDIIVGSGANKDTYTINLNHTHENMAKLIVCEESDLPSTLDNSTIYAITDSGETEIEKLIIRGMEFVGGGGAPSTDPRILSPIGTQIDFNGESTETVTVRATNLSEALTIAVTGVTANLQTISANDAANGVQLTLTKGQNFNSGTLRIYSSEVDKSWNVIDSQALPLLTAIKLTGSQWLKTDYVPKTTTEFEMLVKFGDRNTNNTFGAVLTTNVKPALSGDTYMFRMNTDVAVQNGMALYFGNAKSQNTSYGTQGFQNLTEQQMLSDNTVISYALGTDTNNNPCGIFRFGSLTHFTSLQASDMDSPIMIGYGRITNSSSDNILNRYSLTIYRFTITEGDTTVRNYVPATLDGVPGLHDTITGAFISSETSTPVVAIE